MTGRDIVDDIDALIDEQLAAGEPIGGYDYNDPDYPKCWHCGRDWHGLAITERMNEMRWRGELDPDYRYADDTSRVVCPGSKFIGPLPEDQATATVCQCTWCRLRRHRQQLVADLTRDIGAWPSMRDPLDPSPWLGTNPSVPGIIWREPARWWRLDIPAHRHLEEIEFELNDRGETDDWRRPRATLRGPFTLVMRVGAGLARIQGTTTLEPDRENDLNYARHTYDATRRPLTLDIHAERPNDMGGRIVWHEIDGPGGDYVRSRAVVAASRLNQWFDDRGLWFLAPREFRTAVDRLLDTVDFVPWQRDFLNRAVNAMRRGDNNSPVRGQRDNEQVITLAQYRTIAANDERRAQIIGDV
ncbi:hypothetical protein SEA_FENRY_73 [Gordonia phage Fenry]|nr:hypothetical protein SEA_FENRY_73 [Gordonia phage Fenry]